MAGIRRVSKALRACFNMADAAPKSETREVKTVELSGDGLPIIDKKKERLLVRKLDRYIVPMMMLLYLFSFLDRYSNDRLNPVFQQRIRLTMSKQSQHRKRKALRNRGRPWIDR